MLGSYVWAKLELGSEEQKNMDLTVTKWNQTPGKLISLSLLLFFVGRGYESERLKEIWGLKNKMRWNGIHLDGVNILSLSCTKKSRWSSLPRKNPDNVNAMHPRNLSYGYQCETNQEA
jgi:hypothetical protein